MSPILQNLSQITHEGDLYIVSVKDSALNDILPKLVQRAPQALFVHTAGSVPMNVWQGLAERTVCSTHADIQQTASGRFS